MKRAVLLALAALAGPVLASPALAVPGGDIGTLERGTYVCELPGDALGPRGVHMPDEDFAVVFGSSYRAGGERGTYLLTGDRVTMTSGRLKGQAYRRLSQGSLRRLNPDGSEGDLRCILAHRSNTFAS